MATESPIRLHWLDPRKPDQPFPPVDSAMREPNGLLAIGGDLSVPRIVRAYSRGIFPWYNPDEPILWWSPDPRCVFPVTEDFHVPRSLQRAIRRGDYAISFDTAFDAVVAGCAQPRRKQRGTWLGREMRHAYCELGARGYGHSIEVWREGRLVGGLSGLALGKAFFGESMFSVERDASKIALVWLRRQLHAWGFGLFDCQVGSEHLYSLGAENWPRRRFLDALNRCVGSPAHPAPWRLSLPGPDGSAHLPDGARA